MKKLDLLHFNQLVFIESDDEYVVLFTSTFRDSCEDEYVKTSRKLHCMHVNS